MDESTRPPGDEALLDLLERAVDLDAEARAPLLAGADPEIAEKARDLLRDGVTEGFLDAPPWPGRAAGNAAFAHGPRDPGALDPETLPGRSRVGPYEILDLLGEGGMGRVYLAEQQEPVRRRVALKLLRVALLDRDEAARFEAERQAMGRLDHVNVGRILEAGTTEDGLPFFAMEWIDGPPITRYCDRETLPLRARLELFVDVCRGVEHAHRKLLLHRDLKPSNLLVAEFDGRAVPKIIDFGIAKGLDAALAERTLHTGDRVIGTPAYMSPEALAGGEEIDVRSDVYSLGVVLYELLAGVRPWAGGGDDLVEARRRRREEIPERPSTTVSCLDAEALDRIAAARRETRASLARGLRGDLDWIVTQAIAPNPGERYASAAALADDIERFLRDEPVTARRATARYLVRKLVRRHRRVVGVAAVVVTTLLLGIVGTTLGFLRARDAEDHARREAAVAVQARDEAEKVVDFLSEIFSASGVEGPDADAVSPSERTALELLDRSAERIATGLDIEPGTKARLEKTLGTIYLQIGVFDVAEDHFESALALLDRVDAEPLVRAELLFELAEVHLRQNRLDAGREILAEMEALVPGIPADERPAVEARLRGSTGELASLSGDFEHAVREIEKALAIQRSLPEIEPFELATTESNLGNAYFRARRWRDAETQYRRAKERLESILPAGHARLAVMSDNLGAALASQGRLEEAMPFFENALEIRRRLLGPENPRLADSLNNVGRLHHDLERFESAEALHREALAIRRAVLEKGHPKIAWSLDNLAVTLEALGRVEEAIENQEQALVIRRAALGDEHLDVARSLRHLSILESDPVRAEELASRSLEIRAAVLGEEHPLVGTAHVRLAEVVWKRGDAGRARALFAVGIAVLEAAGDEEALAESRERWRALVDPPGRS